MKIVVIDKGKGLWLEKTKLKIQEKQIGIPKSEATRKNMSKARLGKHLVNGKYI